MPRDHDYGPIMDEGNENFKQARALIFSLLYYPIPISSSYLIQCKSVYVQIPRGKLIMFSLLSCLLFIIKADKA